MQSNGVLSSLQLLTIVLVILLIAITILRQLAVRQYRLKRKGEAEESMLASLGDMLSNTRMSLFDVIHIGIFIVTQALGYSYLSLVVGYENLQLPLLVIAVVLIVVYGWFLFRTVRGRAYRKTERILDDHQSLGLEDLVIQKHLAELLRESEGDDFTQVEVARVTLENLKGKENRTGDAVRQIMENPEQLRDIQPMKTSPRLWKSLRGSLLILVVFAVFLLYSAYNYLSGSMLYLELITNGLVLFFVMTLLLALCLCVEAPQARAANRKARLGI